MDDLFDNRKNVSHLDLARVPFYPDMISAAQDHLMILCQKRWPAVACPMFLYHQLQALLQILNVGGGIYTWFPIRRSGKTFLSTLLAEYWSQQHPDHPAVLIHCGGSREAQSIKREHKEIFNKDTCSYTVSNYERRGRHNPGGYLFAQHLSGLIILDEWMLMKDTKGILLDALRNTSGPIFITGSSSSLTSRLESAKVMRRDPAPMGFPTLQDIAAGSVVLHSGMHVKNIRL